MNRSPPLGDTVRWAGTCGLLLVLASLACTPSEARKKEDARNTVSAFFTALPEGNCQVLGPLLATGGSAKPCEDTVRELREHKMELVEVLDAVVDGRDSNAVLVRAKLARDGTVRPEPFILRVERQDGGWKLRL